MKQRHEKQKRAPVVSACTTTLLLLFGVIGICCRDVNESTDAGNPATEPCSSALTEAECEARDLCEAMEAMKIDL